MDFFRLLVLSLVMNLFFFEKTVSGQESKVLNSSYLDRLWLASELSNDNMYRHNTKKIKVSSRLDLDSSFQDMSRVHHNNISTTIKKNINQVQDKIILDGLRKYGAAIAIGLIIKAETGEVISCSYIENKEIFGAAEQKGSDDIARLSNYLFQNGSVMKLMTLAKALDDRKVTVQSKIDAKTEFHYRYYQIHDYFGKGKILTLPEVFLYSSNIATARIVQKVGWQKEYDFYQNILFENSVYTGRNYTAEVVKPEKKTEFETIMASIGHNVYATPFHYAAAVASLINGGKKVNSTFNPAIKVSHKKSIYVNSDISNQLVQILEMNVIEGTAKRSNIDGYSIGGITSTAEKIINNSYNSRRVVSSFIGVVPANRPKYIVMTIYDEPRLEALTDGYFTAGNNAAPTAGSLIEEVAPLLGINKRKFIRR